MKKFISMLAGVVMASSLFVVSASAANVSATADKEEVKVGDKIVVTIASAEKSVAVDSFWLEYDKSEFSVDSVVNSTGKEVFTLMYDDADLGMTMPKKYSYTHNTAINPAAISFSVSSQDPIGYMANAKFAVVTLTALKDGASTITLQEDSAGGNFFKGVASTINVTVNKAVEEPTVTWKEANTETWTAPAGKKAIWWPFEYAEGKFPGHVFVEITDGSRTETIGVGADADFNINGAVKFAVAVILGADVDATNFDCKVK